MNCLTDKITKNQKINLPYRYKNQSLKKLLPKPLYLN